MSAPAGAARPELRAHLRTRDEDGLVGGVEMLPFGVLLFVAGALVVANLWAVVDTHLSVSSAAREAVRTFVEASDPASGAAAGDAAARRIVAGSGRDGSLATVVWNGAGRDALTRCARVAATVSYRLPALSVPWLGGLGRGVEVSATSTELVDPYRDGLSGVACGS